MSLLLPISCCIEEDTADCEQQTGLYIIVEAEGADTVALPDRATVFLFDNDPVYLTSIQASEEDIAGEVPIAVSYDKRNPSLAVAWGNLGDGEQVSQPVEGAGMENLFISMKKDAAGYAIPMDNLFFGSKQFSGAAVEVVEIYPKTAQIAITVKGLPEGGDAGQYYFTVETPYGGYDFTGTPIADEMIVKLPGVFGASGLVTPEAYHMVHFPETGTAGVTVNLYKDDGTGNPLLLASVDKDKTGRPIVLPVGVITNVLIEIAQTGEIIVSVVITNPGEIYQWDEW